MSQVTRTVVAPATLVCNRFLQLETTEQSPSRRVACMHAFSLVLRFGAASAVSNASLFFYQHIAKTGGTSWSKDLAALGPLKHCVAPHSPSPSPSPSPQPLTLTPTPTPTPSLARCPPTPRGTQQPDHPQQHPGTAPRDRRFLGSQNWNLPTREVPFVKTELQCIPSCFAIKSLLCCLKHGP